MPHEKYSTDELYRIGRENYEKLVLYCMEIERSGLWNQARTVMKQSCTQVLDLYMQSLLLSMAVHSGTVERVQRDYILSVTDIEVLELSAEGDITQETIVYGQKTANMPPIILQLCGVYDQKKGEKMSASFLDSVVNILLCQMYLSKNEAKAAEYLENFYDRTITFLQISESEEQLAPSYLYRKMGAETIQCNAAWLTVKREKIKASERRESLKEAAEEQESPGENTVSETIETRNDVEKPESVVNHEETEQEPESPEENTVSEMTETENDAGKPETVVSRAETEQESIDENTVSEMTETKNDAGEPESVKDHAETEQEQASGNASTKVMSGVEMVQSQNEKKRKEEERKRRERIDEPRREMERLRLEEEQERLAAEQKRIEEERKRLEEEQRLAKEEFQKVKRRLQEREKAEREAQEKRIADLLAELNSLVGLESVKEEIQSLINLIKVRKMREKHNMPMMDMSYHMVFTGSPGTGKTTVARLVARIYKELGILTEGNLVETDRSRLVAGYVGQTAINVREIVEQAIGGVLFIDEAYALVSPDTANDFGSEAVDTLVKLMEDHRDNLVVIVAGYTEEMKVFLKSNSGLISRFNKFIAFNDYSEKQLLDILEVMVGKAGLTIEEGAVQEVGKKLMEMTEEEKRDFGNARGVRNLFERMVMNQANRLVMMGDPDKSELMLLTQEDAVFA